jgi:hypothetical protein
MHGGAGTAGLTSGEDGLSGCPFNIFHDKEASIRQRDESTGLNNYGFESL